jgi:hypothetical protein
MTFRDVLHARGKQEADVVVPNWGSRPGVSTSVSRSYSPVGSESSVLR